MGSKSGHTNLNLNKASSYARAMASLTASTKAGYGSIIEREKYKYCCQGMLTRAATMEADLEKGNGVVGCLSMGITGAGMSRKPGPAPSYAQLYSRRPPSSSSAESEFSDSPCTEDKPIDPSKIVTGCTCKSSKNLTILPFFLPSELGLSRVGKGKP